MSATVEANWETLVELVDGILETDDDRKLHSYLLHTYRDDRIAEGGEYLMLGWRRAPAARNHHHWYEGGLVQHQLEMWGAWVIFAKEFEYRNVWKKAAPHINDARILKAIIYHDLHKAYKTYRLVNEDKEEEITLLGVKAATKWKTEHAKDSSDMMTDTVTKSIMMLSNVGIQLDEEQMNCLLWSEGGFSHNKPKWRSALSVLAYILDEFSSNVLARIDENKMVADNP